MNFFHPQDLPVLAYKDIIQAALLENQVIIIAGDTGCGKTTQLPKFCLEMDQFSNGVIGCTQPRRIAAITVSERVREELGNDGTPVGYKIRFHDHTNRSTRIKFMTDGVLLAETKQDHLLKKYSVIIVDEAHERSLNIDFLIGFLKNLLPQRPDLKVVITSATIDTASFAAHFSDSPIINIEGQTFPVTVQYSPVENNSEDEGSTYIDHCAQTIIDLHHHQPGGDVLAFLPTEKDIRSCCDMLTKKLENAAILPLFGRLQAADQKRIFLPHKLRKIIIATNVAETSITVPNIRYVIDSGLARMSFYNSRAKTTSLPIRRISKASCDQRRGRCGRVGPGLCIRLYSEEDYNDRIAYTVPEIQRSNLAEVILQMVSLKLGRPENFPFIDVPARNAIRDGYKLLNELGAINSQGCLTSRGRLMAKLPIDPCISRIIIEGKKNRCLKEIKIIASALAIQDPRVRPADHEKEADQAHSLFAHPHSDFLALLHIWQKLHGAHDQIKSWSRLKKFCKKHYLSFQRMREWFDLHEQMSRILDTHGNFSNNDKEATYADIHKSLASGFLRNLAIRKKGKLYQGCGNREIMIFPGSHQFTKSGNWIIAASFLETNRLYALTVATIEPEWLEQLGGNLCSYSWTNARWQKKTGRVVCDEKVSLFGLVIIAKRTTNFGSAHPKNRKAAQDIFIQHALIQGEISGNYPFLQHNTALIQKWRHSEEKLRKRDVVIDDVSLHDYYSKRLPDFVYDRSTLIQFLKKNKTDHFLRMDKADILKRQLEDRELVDLPSYLTIGNNKFQLEYNFKPGSDDDGVTIRIPFDLAETLKPTFFEWLVPGLLREKTETLLKGLPKKLRKQLVPINITIDRVLDDMTPYEGSYYRSLESSLLKLYNVSIRRSDWPTPLPAHLTMRFLLFDPSGKILFTGRDLKPIKGHLEISKDAIQKGYLKKGEQQLVDSFEGQIFHQYDFDSLPEKLPLYTKRGEISGYLYPTILAEPQKRGVNVSFLNEKEKAIKLTQQGILYLYRLNFSDQYKVLRKSCMLGLSGPSAFWLTKGLNGKKEAVEATINFILKSIFLEVDNPIPTRQDFSQTVARVKKNNFYHLGKKVLEEITQILRERHGTITIIHKYAELSKRSNIFDTKRFNEYENLLAEILPVNFLQLYNEEDIEDARRYLKALAIRIERAHTNPAKDSNKSKQLTTHLNNLVMLSKKEEELPSQGKIELQNYHKMIQEFRISLYAPEIGTKIPVSLNKLKEQLALLKLLT